MLAWLTWEEASPADASQWNSFYIGQAGSLKDCSFPELKITSIFVSFKASVRLLHSFVISLPLLI